MTTQRQRKWCTSVTRHIIWTLITLAIILFYFDCELIASITAVLANTLWLHQVYFIKKELELIEYIKRSV